MPVPATPTTETLTGIVERITFHSSESGYTVARLKLPKTDNLTTIIGNFANIQAGQTLQITGFWRDHPQYGPQLQVTHYTETKPASLTGIEKYLGSGLIKGVGSVTAKRIVNHFGLETLDIIENNVERLTEIKGIGKKRIEQIAYAWEQQKAIKEVMMFLQGHGVSTVYATKIYKQYGTGAIATVMERPYQLAEDIYGIGFLTADKIAENVGIPLESKFRYKAGILHTLTEATSDGHCFLPESELVEKAKTLLTKDEHEAEAASILAVITQMQADKDLMKDGADGEVALYKPSIFHTEQNLAQLLHQRLIQTVEADIPRVRNWIQRFTQSRQIQLSQQQQLAVETSAYSQMMILTGGPGCGKTFTTATIVELWKAMGKSILLAAPTGRAAQRLGEVTKLPAQTLHRLLEFDPKTMDFLRDEDNPLKCDALIIDESSMLDIFLAYSLVKALPENCQLLVVGDADQLPSVGPGNVLKDLISSGKIPVVKLTQVFRQAAQSAIVAAAHKINQGKLPQFEPISNSPKSDCLWHGGGTQPEHGVQTICDLVEHFIPSIGLTPTKDLQVLCPMSRGLLGTRNLNKVLQELINPPTPEKTEVVRGATIFRVGDRVIQQTNDYKREVFNGDLGIINSIDTTEQEVVVNFGERSITYDYPDLNEIALAWSISIHKSQGSEYPVVILPLYMQHYLMLNRNLLYTGITRAKKLVIVVGSKKAISIAVRNEGQQRYTRLQSLFVELRSICPSMLPSR